MTCKGHAGRALYALKADDIPTADLVRHVFPYEYMDANSQPVAAGKFPVSMVLPHLHRFLNFVTVEPLHVLNRDIVAS